MVTPATLGIRGGTTCLRTHCRDRAGQGLLRRPTAEFQGPPAGSWVHSRPQAHRGAPVSLHLPRILEGQTLARCTGCGLPAPSLLVGAGGHKKLLETRDPGDRQAWHSASSSLPSLLLTRRLSSPGRPQARPPSTPRSSRTAPGGFCWAPSPTPPFAERLSPEDAPGSAVFRDSKRGTQMSFPTSGPNAGSGVTEPPVVGASHALFCRKGPVTALSSHRPVASSAPSIKH